MRTVRLSDGSSVPALGQGTWHLGERPGHEAEERAALVAGLEAGATLIDTAEMYGEGAAEALVGRALVDAAGSGISREQVTLVSKVYPWNAGGSRLRQSCEASLRRLGTDYLDLYLLHWPGDVPLEETVAGMEALRARGLIRRWGVSNFDVDHMRALWRVPGGQACAVNQVLYHVASRGVEFDLLPWMRAHGVAAMAYCPLAEAGALSGGILDDPLLAEIARAHGEGATPAQVLLAFVLRDGATVAIPKAARADHARENAAAAGLVLTEAELAALDDAWPAPSFAMPLDVV